MQDDIITSGKQFADFASDLLDEEIQAVARVVVSVQEKYAHRANSVDNLEAMRDELLTRLANEVGVLATVDPAPCFYGEPPICEIIGKVAGDERHTEGLDHEHKKFEVQASKERGEDYYGQREPVKGTYRRRDTRDRHKNQDLQRLQDRETEK